jgi:cysteine desulfurase/selenocysteine lyase
VVYLDTASTAQKPRPVIDRIARFYAAEYAKNDTPYRRGREATGAYQAARAAAARFLDAPSPETIVFTRNTTEAINLVASGFARDLLEAGDEILVTQLEHHSNLVPWHMACERTGAVLRVAPLDAGGDIDLEQLARLLTRKTRLVSVVHVSNVTGGRQPVEDIVELAHDRGVPVLVDGAQAAPHIPVDVRAIGCDFYAFSGHKTYGPSGVGVLYGTADWLDRLPPSLGGEPMAVEVTFDGYEVKPPPEKFSAGVPALASTVALADALEYLSGLGREAVAAHVRGLAKSAAVALGEIDGVTVLGRPRDRVSCVAFTLDGIDPQEVAEFLDETAGVAVRSGHLSARPLLKVLGTDGAVRASFGAYNTPAEVKVLADAVRACVASGGKAG